MTPTLRSRLQRSRRSRGGRDRTGRDHRSRDRKVEATGAETAQVETTAEAETARSRPPGPRPHRSRPPGPRPPRPRPPRPRPHGRDHQGRGRKVETTETASNKRQESCWGAGSGDSLNVTRSNPNQAPLRSFFTTTNDLFSNLHRLVAAHIAGTYEGLRLAWQREAPQNTPLLPHKKARPFADTYT
jgi:hypothetical protein